MDGINKCNWRGIKCKQNSPQTAIDIPGVVSQYRYEAMQELARNWSPEIFMM